MRVFSHTCSNTEIVCALGMAHCLVGVDADSDYPTEVVSQLPSTGRDLDLNIDEVCALKPDLVLSSLTVPGHEKIVTALQKTGIDVLVCDPISLDDVFSDIQRIAAALGVPERGEKLVADMQVAMPAVEATTRPRLLVEWWPKPVIIPGKQSWVTGIIHRAGGINPLAQVDVKSQPMENSDAAALDADAVVMSWCGVKVEKYRASVVAERPHWQTVPAVINHRIFPISEAYLGRPGPRLVEGYRQLRTIIDNLE